MTDPFEPFDRIREAIQAAIGPFGVEFITWNIIPGDGDEGDERMCSVLLSIMPEAFLPEDVKTINSIMAETERADRERESKKRQAEAHEIARQGLLNIQKDGGLFG